MLFANAIAKCSNTLVLEVQLAKSFDARYQSLNVLLGPVGCKALSLAKDPLQPTVHCVSFIIILSKPFGITEYVRPANLLGTSRFFRKLVVCRQTIVHDKLASLILKDRHNNFVTSSAVHFIPRDFLVHHAPDPVTHSIKSPTSFITPFDRSIADFLLNFCIMRAESSPQLVERTHDFCRADAERVRASEKFNNLFLRQRHPYLEKSYKQHHAQPKTCSRKRVRNVCFDELFAVSAIPALNQIFRDDGWRNGLQVFDTSLADFLHITEPTTTTRANKNAHWFDEVNPFRNFSPITFVAFWCAERSAHFMRDVRFYERRSSFVYECTFVLVLFKFFLDFLESLLQSLVFFFKFANAVLFSR